MQKIKIGLLGLGRTGKIVAESLFNDNKFDLMFAVKKTAPKIQDYNYSVETKEVLPELIKQFQPEVLIDFTVPKATLENIRYLKRNTGIVIATTGFNKKQLTKLYKTKNIKMLYAPNISDGINVLMKACGVIDKLWPKADIEIIEQHFKHKIDAPSGTAKKIANIFDKEIPIHAIRAGGIVGIHEIIFAKPNQKITVKHESFSKEVFAEGAKRAVLWLIKQKNGFYEMKDMYNGAK